MPWQPVSLLFPDAEQLMCDRTRTGLADDTVTVSNRIPNPRPANGRMVVWNRDGGAIDGFRDQPRMRARVWAPTDDEANELARQLVAVVMGLPDGNPILRVVHESGPYDVPDTSQAPQKYLLFTVHTRGAKPS